MPSKAPMASASCLTRSNQATRARQLSTLCVARCCTCGTAPPAGSPKLEAFGVGEARIAGVMLCDKLCHYIR